MRMIILLILFPLALNVMACSLSAQAPGTPAPGAPLPADSPQETAAPELLPRSDALPDPAPLYPNLSKTPKAGRPAVSAEAEPEPTPYVSPEERRLIQQRLEKIRALAGRNPESVSLLKLASTALSVEARRNYLRAYYVTVCMRMREMEPRLGGYIREFERERIRAIGRSKTPQIPGMVTK